MLDKLETIEERYKQIEQQLADPQALSDIKLFAKLNKEYKELTKIHKVFQEYKNVTSNIQSAREILYNEKDEELKEMAKTELEKLNMEQEKLESELRMMLIPRDRKTPRMW